MRWLSAADRKSYVPQFRENLLNSALWIIRMYSTEYTSTVYNVCSINLAVR